MSIDGWESMSIDGNRCRSIDGCESIDGTRSIDRSSRCRCRCRNVGTSDDGQKTTKRKNDKPTNGAIGGPSLNPREGRCVTLDGS